MSPEQYNVFLGGQKVGYLRLRHGHFRADWTEHPQVVTVYRADPLGDGSFEDAERKKYLTEAVRAIDTARKGVAA